MAKKSVYDQVKNGLTAGIYKSIRLVRINDQGVREVLVPFSKVNKAEAAIERLDHIQYQLKNKLAPGAYVIEARCGISKTSIVDSFEVTIKTPITIPIKAGENGHTEQELIDKTNEQENMRQDIDLDDYIAMIKENEMLKAKVALLTSQIDMMAKTPLNDSPKEPDGIAGRLFKALEDNMPTALGIFDTFLKQRDKNLELRDRELSLKERGGSKKKVMGVNRQQVLSEMEALYNQDEKAFNVAMDQIGESDPPLYKFLCDKMGLTEEEEEEEEQE